MDAGLCQLNVDCLAMPVVAKINYKTKPNIRRHKTGDVYLRQKVVRITVQHVTMCIELTTVQSNMWHFLTAIYNL
jgi:hypothetical protein